MRKSLLGVMLAVTAALPATVAAQQVPEQEQEQERARGNWRSADDGQQRQPRFDRGDREAQAIPQEQARGWGDASQRRQERRNREDNQVRQQVQIEQQAQLEQQAQIEQQRRAQQRRYGEEQRWRSDEARRDGSRFGQDTRGERDGGWQWQDRGERGDARFGRNGAGQEWQRGYADRRDDMRFNDRFGGRGQWNRGWRGNDHYDYRDYRSSNRGAFRLPRYYAPYGWDDGYRRFSIGVRLNSVLWGQNYWIDDPYDYRLPPAYGPYRWVRYYNDALLVDIRSGYVVDTVYDIFW